jgi:hypothetical protein
LAKVPENGGVSILFPHHFLGNSPHNFIPNFSQLYPKFLQRIVYKCVQDFMGFLLGVQHVFLSILHIISSKIVQIASWLFSEKIAAFFWGSHDEFVGIREENCLRPAAILAKMLRSTPANCVKNIFQKTWFD